MALSEFEIKRTEKLVADFVQKIRPPAHIRNKLDIGFRMTGQSVEIFEVRPNWKEPSVKMEHPVAKATYVKSSGMWKVYWQRADLKWHGYEPTPQVAMIEEFLSLIAEDKNACFFG